VGRQTEATARNFFRGGEEKTWGTERSEHLSGGEGQYTFPERKGGSVSADLKKGEGLSGHGNYSGGMNRFRGVDKPLNHRRVLKEG